MSNTNPDDEEPELEEESEGGDEEEKLLEAEFERSPERAAEWLRELAAELEAGEELTVSTDDETVTVELPTDEIEFEVELEREPEDDDRDEIELEVELEWLVPSAASDEEIEE